MLKTGETKFEFPVRERKPRGAPKAGNRANPRQKLISPAKRSLENAPNAEARFLTRRLDTFANARRRTPSPANLKSIRVIAQQPIEPAQAAKILETQKTDLLDKFISKAGKPFSAYLVMDGKGKITFDFPESN